MYQLTKSILINLKYQIFISKIHCLALLIMIIIYISANNTLIELKRKNNREASRISRKKKNEDIINLIKTSELLKNKIRKQLIN